jgi:hypothetical protein
MMGFQGSGNTSSSWEPQITLNRQLNYRTLDKTAAKLRRALLMETNAVVLLPDASQERSSPPRNQQI